MATSLAPLFLVGVGLAGMAAVQAVAPDLWHGGASQIKFLGRWRHVE